MTAPLSPSEPARPAVPAERAIPDTLAAHAPVGLFHTDAAGSCVYVNERWCDLTGLTPEEARGNGWSRALHPEDCECVFSEWQAAATERRLFELEYRFQRADGKVTWVVGRAVAETDATGRVTGHVGTVMDITERKRTESLNDAFAQLGRALNLAVTQQDAGRIIIDAADRLLGLDSALLHLYFPETRRVRRILTVDTVENRRVEIPAEAWATNPSPMFQRVMAEGPQFVDRQQEAGAPELVPFGEKGRRSASLLFVPVHNGRRTVGILSIQSYRPGTYARRDLDTLQTLADYAGGALERVQAQEATRIAMTQLELRVEARTGELRQSEERQRAMLGALPDLMFLQDCDGVYLDYHAGDPAALLLAPGEFLGRNFRQVLPPDLARQLAESFEWVASTGEMALIEYDLPIQGNTRHFEARITRCGEDRFITIVRDITQRVRATRERERLIGELQDALAEVKTLSGLLPICGWCRKVRDDRGYWDNVEGYFKRHSRLQFSHGMCPDCQRKVMLELEATEEAAKPAAVPPPPPEPAE